MGGSGARESRAARERPSHESRSVGRERTAGARPDRASGTATARAARALACGSSGCVSAAAWRAGGVSGTASETTSGTTGKRHVRRAARQARGSAPAGAASVWRGRGTTEQAGAASALESQRVVQASRTAHFRCSFVTLCHQLHASRALLWATLSRVVGGGLPLELLDSSTLLLGGSTQRGGWAALPGAMAGPLAGGWPNARRLPSAAARPTRPAAAATSGQCCLTQPSTRVLRGLPDQQPLPRRGTARLDGTPTELATEMQAGARPSWAERLSVTCGVNRQPGACASRPRRRSSAGHRASVRAAPQRDQESINGLSGRTYVGA